MIYWTFEILRVVLVPVILVLMVYLYLSKFTNVKDQETSGIILGAVVGVVLGFAANLIQDGFNDLYKKHQMREVASKLLGEDVKGVYHTIWLWDNLMKNPTVPEEIKRQIPPEFDLNYWNTMKEDKEFLMLGNNDPFDKIFEEMWNFEKINEQIKLAKQGDKQAYQLAILFYKRVVDDGSCKKLLPYFMNKDQIEELNK